MRTFNNDQFFDSASDQQDMRLSSEGRDSQRQKRSKTAARGKLQGHNALILVDSNGGGTVTQVREENHSGERAKGKYFYLISDVCIEWSVNGILRSLSSTK